MSLDTESETFEKFVEDNGIQWPQRHEADGWNSAAARAFEVTGLPSHYVVDRDGRFVQIPVGNPELLARTVAAMVNER